MRNKFIPIARKLRKQQTPHEVKLWQVLRSRNLKDLKFRRQYPVGRYVVDFCCFKEKLIIELDGGGHNEDKQTKEDQIRDKYLKNQGFTVLRVWNNELDENLEGVIDKISELTNKD